jgi:HSP20 family protein
VDIFEKDHDLVIRAELPGVNEDGSAYRLERVYGAFTRSFTLPTTVDASKIEAAYKDGVLQVTVPKLEAAKPKKVQIKAA